MRIETVVTPKRWKKVIAYSLFYMSAQTLLFIASFNLFSPLIRGLLVGGFVIYLVAAWRRYRTLEAASIFPTVRIFLPALMVAILILLLPHLKGPLTLNQWLLNFDWGKHNSILQSLTQNPLHPQLGVQNGMVDLAYYYAIYLPSGYITFLLKGVVNPSLLLTISGLIFEVWLLLGQVLALTILPLVINTLFSPSKKLTYFGISFVVFVLFAQMDGWEFLLRTGEWYRGDIEWGPAPWHFAPLRLQSFLSYSHWLPGHLVASILGLFILIIFKKSSDLKALPLGLISIYTVSSSLFAFLSLQLFWIIFLLSNKLLDLKDLITTRLTEIAIAVSGSVLVLLFYANTMIYESPTLLFKLVTLMLLAGLGFITLLSSPRVFEVFDRHWQKILALLCFALFSFSFLDNHLLFAHFSHRAYLIFFLKEFGHIALLIFIYRLITQEKIPSITGWSGMFILLLSLGGNPDFIFSGSIGALMLISSYLAYCFEKILHRSIWLPVCILVYLLAVGPSFYSLYYETWQNIPRSPLSFKERQFSFRPEWIGVLTKYTSPYLERLRL